MQTHNSWHLQVMLRLSLIFLLFPLRILAQENGGFYDYKTAFNNRDRVKSISIQCAFDNLRTTDGCNDIPDSIYYFKNLEYLSITETKVKEFPVGINKLSRLKTIHIGLNYKFNYELELPKLIGIDSLEFLDLWMTDFEKLPSCVSEIKTLKNVGISFNHQIDLKNAFQTLSSLPNLKSLNISGIKSKTIPKNIKLLKGVISVELGYLRKINLKVCLSRLSKLNLKYLNLENDGIFKLPSQIGLLTHLVYLNLGNNYLSELPDEIYQLKNLRTINLYKSGIDDKQIIEFKKRLPNCNVVFEPHSYIN